MACSTNPLTWNECAGDALGSGAEKLASSAADAFFEMIANGARDLLETTSTFWMKVPDPQVATGSGQNWTGSETIVSVQGWISPVALVIFVVTVAVTLLKVGYDTRRAADGVNGVMRALVTTLAAGLPLLAATMLALQFGEEFSPWILEKASGKDASDGFILLFQKALFGGGTGVPTASGALLLIYLLTILAAIMQVLFMIVRSAAIIALLCFAQVTAAGTATEEGWTRFKRLAALVLAFVLYKPVAAVIYAVGIKLMSTGADTKEQIYNSIFGLTVILMAALALPALMKFVAPAAAMGSSSAFSGGAAVGMVATGAAMVALAGTGGGAAAAPGAAGFGGSRSSGNGGGGETGAKDAVPSGDGGTGGGGTGGGDSSTGNGAANKPTATTPQREPVQQGSGAPASRGSSSPTQGRSDQSAGRTAAQTGASMVQNVSGQVSRAGEDAANS